MSVEDAKAAIETSGRFVECITALLDGALTHPLRPPPARVLLPRNAMTTPSPTLAANVMHFARLLRRAGLPVGPAESARRRSRRCRWSISATAPRRAPRCARR